MANVAKALLTHGREVYGKMHLLADVLMYVLDEPTTAESTADFQNTSAT